MNRQTHLIVVVIHTSIWTKISTWDSVVVRFLAVDTLSASTDTAVLQGSLILRHSCQLYGDVHYRSPVVLPVFCVRSFFGNRQGRVKSRMFRHYSHGRVNLLMDCIVAKSYNDFRCASNAVKLVHRPPYVFEKSEGPKVQASHGGPMKKK